MTDKMNSSATTFEEVLAIGIQRELSMKLKVMEHGEEKVQAVPVMYVGDSSRSYYRDDRGYERRGGDDHGYERRGGDDRGYERRGGPKGGNKGGKGKGKGKGKGSKGSKNWKNSKGSKGKGRGSAGGGSAGGGKGRGNGFGGMGDPKPNQGRGNGSSRECTYCEQNGHTYNFCWARKSDAKKKGDGNGKEDRIVSVNLAMPVVTQVFGYLTPILLLFICTVIGLFCTSLIHVETTLVTVFVGMMTILKPELTYVLNSAIGNHKPNNKVFAYDTAAMKCVVRDPNALVKCVWDKHLKIVGVNGFDDPIQSVWSGFLRLWIYGTTIKGEPIILHLESGRGSRKRWPRDTMFVKDCPVNLISSEYLKKMGFDFYNLQNEQAYLYHPVLQTKVMLHLQDGLLQIPVNHNWTKGPECVRSIVENVDESAQAEKKVLWKVTEAQAKKKELWKAWEMKEKNDRKKARKDQD
jgi:hypothetical protein